ncbi:MAG: hypothetical protein AAF849_24715 [Bacteroidota bacterium]
MRHKNCRSFNGNYTSSIAQFKKSTVKQFNNSNIQINNKTTYRYPGAQPFSTAQQDLFFGREEDIAALSRMIRLEPLVVLYSKSGLGKSSLLSAGIVPKMEQEGKYQAVKIRFQAYSERYDENSLPVQTTLAAVQQQLNKESTFIEDFLPEETSLWYTFKRFQAQQPERELKYSPKIGQVNKVIKA